MSQKIKHMSQMLSKYEELFRTQLTGFSEKTLSKFLAKKIQLEESLQEEDNDIVKLEDSFIHFSDYFWQEMRKLGNVLNEYQSVFDLSNHVTKIHCQTLNSLPKIHQLQLKKQFDSICNYS